MATIDLGKIKQVFRGTYNNATAYAVDDLVAFTDGSVTSTYICTTASTGNNPSSGGTAHGSWAYVAKGVADPIPTQSGQSGKFLTTNGSALSFGTVSAGITDADQWRVTSNFSISGGGTIASNWERNDNNFDKIGNGMSESSGIFTFPSTGLWRILVAFNANASNITYVGAGILATTDNSSYGTIAENYDSATGTGYFACIVLDVIFDCTNTSTHKVKFNYSTQGSTTYEGHSTVQRTCVTFIRLGDT